MPRKEYRVIKDITFSLGSNGYGSTDIIHVLKNEIVEIEKHSCFIHLSNNIIIEKTLHDRILREYFEEVGKTEEQCKQIKAKKEKVVKVKKVNKFSRIFQGD